MHKVIVILTDILEGRIKFNEFDPHKYGLSPEEEAIMQILLKTLLKVGSAAASETLDAAKQIVLGILGPEKQDVSSSIDTLKTFRLSPLQVSMFMTTVNSLSSQKSFDQDNKPLQEMDFDELNAYLDSLLGN